LKNIEKLIIAKRIIKALYTIQVLYRQINGNVIAHSHLSTKNIFVNIADMQVQIGDFGMPALKKFCKLFNGYEMLNVYSAPEIWEKLYNGMTQNMKNLRFDGKSHFFN